MDEDAFCPTSSPVSSKAHCPLEGNSRRHLVTGYPIFKIFYAVPGARAPARPLQTPFTRPSRLMYMPKCIANLKNILVWQKPSTLLECVHLPLHGQMMWRYLLQPNPTATSSTSDIAVSVYIAFERRGLLLNMGKNKTALVPTFRGPEAPQFRKKYLLTPGAGLDIKVPHEDGPRHFRLSLECSYKTSRYAVCAGWRGWP